MDLRDKMSAPEVAAAIGCHIRTVQQWQTRNAPGKPRAEKIGRDWYFNRQEVAEYAAKKKGQ
ncbi:phage terminase Nu1 subunit (DNA packaging protein) [Buttiauxella sp. BIGb0471]|uniref:helix-turn-helix domain-containing protein n=1 Tax=Buttiauxella sp. BIGb0471 TaxID=2940597 RepID=UPI0038576B81|nr:phage terminase Nu1 subunit (DNA packaging protein) [Buttiauxella sp. BIGb0471]